MQQVPVKNTGDELAAAEFTNGTSQEVQNVVLQAGIVLSAGDLTQLGQAISIYAAGGMFYTDGGSANVVTLSVVGLKKAPPAYFNGQRIVFFNGNINTGATTVNVASVGAVDLRLRGVALASGFLAVGDLVEAIFDSINGWFDIKVRNNIFGIADTSTGAPAASISNTTFNMDGNIIGNRFHSQTVSSGFVSGQTVSITIPTAGEAQVFMYWSTRHTGTSTEVLSRGTVNYSGNGSDTINSDLAGSGITINATSTTITSENTSSTATLYLTIMRVR